MKKQELINMIELARDNATQTINQFANSGNPQEKTLADIARGRFDAFTDVIDAINNNPVCLKISAGL